MIPQGHGVVFCGIHKLNSRLAFTKVDQVIILNSIACIKKNDILTLLLEVLLQCRHGCHAVNAFGSTVVPMRIIRMHDYEIGEIGCKSRAAKASHGQSQKGGHFFHHITPEPSNYLTSYKHKQNRLNHIYYT